MSLTVDFRGWERGIRRVAEFERQIPFALAQALNRSVEVARREIIDTTWAQHVKVRNPRFLENALTTRGSKATKRNLRVVLYDKNGRGNLKLHDEGGAAHGRGAMAIPVSAIGARRTGKGVPKGMQPRNLSNSFGVVGKKGNPVVYQRTGRYQKAGKPTKTGKRAPAQDNRHLRLAYVTKPSNPVRADVPFHRDFERVMRREMPRQFRTAIRQAMATAFKRK